MGGLGVAVIGVTQYFVRSVFVHFVVVFAVCAGAIVSAYADHVHHAVTQGAVGENVNCYCLCF